MTYVDIGTAKDHYETELNVGDYVVCIYRGGYKDQSIGDVKKITEISLGQICFGDNMYRQAKHWVKLEETT